MSSVTLSPSTVATNDPLSASVVSSDADGDALSLSYDWYVDGVLTRSGSSSSLSGASYFDRDEVVYVEVTADEGADTDSETSSSVTVDNTAPSAPEVAITPEEPEAGDDLTCAVTTASTDADGDALTYAFTWEVNGVAYSSAVDGALASVVDGADVGEGESWTCSVTADDGSEVGDEGADSVSPTSDEPCHAVYMNAATSSATFTNTGFGVGTGAWTFEWWLKHEGGRSTSTDMHLFNMNESYSAYAIRPRLDGSAAMCYTYNNTSGGHNVDIVGGTVTDGDWHHIACDYDGAGTASMWVDGVLVGTDAAAPSIQANSPMSLGRPSGYTYEAADVHIGPTRYSNSVRYTSSFAPSTSWTVDSATIAQYLVSSGLSGTTITDEAGGNNNGTVRSGIDASGWCD